jgi:hypothetical protein
MGFGPKSTDAVRRVKAKGSGQPADEPCAGFGAAGSHEYAGDFAKGASRLR